MCFFRLDQTQIEQNNNINITELNPGMVQNIRHTGKCSIKLLLALFTLLTPFFLSAQTVPSKMKFAGMDLTITPAARKKIQASVDALVRSPTHFQIKVDRAHLYFPYIEKAFRDEGVSDDFKYLVIQESGMVSDAVSSSNAVGFWQFKDFTAKEVGLSINSKVDERKHIIRSSHGAAKYLQQNNIFFGNWIYALQAYNTGASGAKKTAKSKYFGKKKMDIESSTHWYVLKFLAHKVAFDAAFRKKDTQPLELIEYKCKNESISSIAKKFNIELAELKKYNKWLKVSKIPNDRKYYSVMVPVQKQEAELAREKAQDEQIHIAMENDVEETKKNDHVVPKAEKLPGWFLKRKRKETTPDNPHIITRLNGLVAIKAKQGDSKDKLAINGGIRTIKFLKYNDVKSFHKIKIGEFYYLQSKKSKHFSRYHIVLPGEHLWGIAQKYGIKLKSLAKKNRMEPYQPLKFGQKLWLKETRPKSTPIEYVEIKIPEETLPEVIKEEPKKDIKKAADVINSLPKHEHIKVDSSEIHSEVEKEWKNVKKEFEGKVLKYHIVKQKESLYAISKMYNTTPDQIKSWNDLAGYDISIDQKIIVGWEKQKSNTTPKVDSAGIKKEEEKKENVQPELPVKTDQEPESKESESKEPEFIIHVVKQKETLYSISKMYKVSIPEIMELNKKEVETLSIDEELKIQKR